MARDRSSRVPQKPLGGLFIVAVALWVFAGVGGCAIIPAEPGTGGPGGEGGTASAKAIDPEPVTQDVGVMCANSVTTTWPDFKWELTVDPGPIESGGRFSAMFDGVPFFPRDFFEIAQVLIEGGVTEVNLVDFQATVSAHAGATGPDVVLALPDLPYQCALENPPGTRPSCDPANDLPGGPGGLVGNTDCQPEGPSNPCGRFVDIPTSEDCAPEGVCWNVGRDDPGAFCPEDDFCQATTKDQCAANGFCVTGNLPFPLQPAIGEFVADSDGEVLFGWHEPDRGSSWDVPASVFEEPVGFIGLRVYVGGAQVALECVLGQFVDGVSGPVPDSKLISFDIPESGCVDGTSVCPPAFASYNGGDCRFSDDSSVFHVEDPIVLEDPSQSSCQGPPGYSVGGSFLPTEAAVESPSLNVRATTEVRNVDDELCAAKTDIIANVDHFDADDQYLFNYLVVFNLPSVVSASRSDPELRSTNLYLWSPPVAWSSGPEVCCERVFQTTWVASVAQCEGW